MGTFKFLFYLILGGCFTSILKEFTIGVFFIFYFLKVYLEKPKYLFSIYLSPCFHLVRSPRECVHCTLCLLYARLGGTFWPVEVICIPAGSRLAHETLSLGMSSVWCRRWEFTRDRSSGLVCWDLAPDSLPRLTFAYHPVGHPLDLPSMCWVPAC